MRNSMENIKVSVKLAISIGAIFLLIIILAANGLFNINHILMRGDITLQLTQIDLASKDLLIANGHSNSSANEQYVQ